MDVGLTDQSCAYIGVCRSEGCGSNKIAYTRLEVGIMTDSVKTITCEPLDVSDSYSAAQEH